jgi:hypothetical protein
MCVVGDDAIRHAYLHRGDAMSRTQLDARNSEVRESTVYEMISDKWNDEAFNPTVPVSSVHEDFKREIVVSTMITQVPKTMRPRNNILIRHFVIS